MNPHAPSLAGAGSRHDIVAARLASILLTTSAAAALALPSVVHAQASAARATATPAPGLTYKSLREGTGASPVATDAVKVHYRGTLMNGTEFDSSYKRNEPASFPLNGVVPCWTQGLQKLKVGGKAQLTCPSDAAYGDEGRPPTIPGGATLVFDVELLEVAGK